MDRLKTDARKDRYGNFAHVRIMQDGRQVAYTTCHPDAIRATAKWLKRVVKNEAMPRRKE